MPVPLNVSKRFWSLILTSAILTILSGCGYHLSNLSGLTHQPNAKHLSLGKNVTFSVQTFHNGTVFPLVETQVTQLLKDEMLKVSGVTLVNNPKYADLVLSGTVVSASEIPLALSSVQGIEQYLVEIVLSAKVTGYDGKVIWSGGSIIGSAPMYVNINLAIFQQNQSYAMNEASQAAVSRLVSSMAHNLKSATFIIPNQNLSQPMSPQIPGNMANPFMTAPGTPGTLPQQPGVPGGLPPGEIP